jgi:hypothetical protein
MPKQVSEKQGFVDVTSTILKGGKTVSERKQGGKIKVRPFVTETANVSVKYGATVPMGDYSSARIDVMISMPCYVEEAMDMYKDLRATVDALVSKEMDKLTGGGDGKSD